MGILIDSVPVDLDPIIGEMETGRDQAAFTEAIVGQRGYTCQTVGVVDDEAFIARWNTSVKLRKQARGVEPSAIG